MISESWFEDAGSVHGLLIRERISNFVNIECKESVESDSFLNRIFARAAVQTPAGPAGRKQPGVFSKCGEKKKESETFVSNIRLGGRVGPAFRNSYGRRF